VAGGDASRCSGHRRAFFWNTPGAENARNGFFVVAGLNYSCVVGEDILVANVFR